MSFRAKRGRKRNHYLLWSCNMRDDALGALQTLFWFILTTFPWCDSYCHPSSGALLWSPFSWMRKLRTGVVLCPGMCNSRFSPSKPGFSNSSRCQNHPLKQDWGVSFPELLSVFVWGKAQEFAFLTNSQWRWYFSFRDYSLRTPVYTKLYLQKHKSN